MKKFNFAITDNTTYTGKDALDFYSLALLGFRTGANLTLVPNVKSKIKLAKFDLGNLIQSDDCVFSGTGEGTLAQTAFEVCDFKINLEYCTSTFEQNFLNESMRPGSNTGEVMPEVFQSYVVSEVFKKAANDLEGLAWKGVGTGATYPVALCEGLEAKLLADSTVIDVTATTVTSANVLAELAKVYAAIPDAVLAQGDVVIYAPTNVVKAYELAQASAGAGQGFNYAGVQTLNYLGLPIVWAPGMTSNKMVAASKKNMLFLTDLQSDFTDENAIRIIPQIDKSGASTVRIVGRFKFGVGFMYGAEVVYYN